MRVFHKGIAVLLCMALCIGAGGAVAGGKYDKAEQEARWERLLRFVTEEWADWDAYDATHASFTAKEYEQEKLGTPRDYSKVERLYLEDFNQAQFEDILPQVRGLCSLDLTNCAIEDFSPLLRMPSLESLALDWGVKLPGQLAALAKLPKLPALELGDVPADADLKALLVLTGLEKLALSFEGDALCDLSPIGELPKLRALTLDAWAEFTGPMPDLPALEEFRAHMNINQALLKHTPALRALELHWVSFDADLASLAALVELEKLEISFESDSDSDQSLLPKLPSLLKLRSLAMDGPAGGWGTSISSLPDLPALEEFSTNADIDPALFVHTPALRVLHFPGGGDFRPLSALTGLEKLDLERYLPDDFSPLYGLPMLRYLEIDGYHVEDYVEALEALHQAMPDLKIVLYSCC